MNVCWRHIKVYSCIYMFVIWPIDSFPAAPARLARLKAANLPLPLVHTRHSSSSANRVNFCIVCLFRPAPPARLAGLGLAVAALGGSATRPALHAPDPSPCSHPCSNSQCFHLVSRDRTRIRTTVVRTVRQHTSICKTKHEFANPSQWTSKSTIYFLDHNLAKEHCR